MNSSRAIRSRRSVRKFLDKAVPFDRLMDCIDAGNWAPSAGNLQNVRFLIVEKEETKQLLANACFDQQWMVTAPYIIVLCNDPKEVLLQFGDRGEKYASQAAAAAAMNIMIEAYDHGLATCWVGAFDEHAIRRALNMPEEIIPEIIIPIGFAAEAPHSSRVSADLITFFEEWGKRLRPGHRGIIRDLAHAASKKLKSLGKKGSIP